MRHGGSGNNCGTEVQCIHRESNVAAGPLRQWRRANRGHAEQSGAKWEASSSRYRRRRGEASLTSRVPDDVTASTVTSRVPAISTKTVGDLSPPASFTTYCWQVLAAWNAASKMWRKGDHFSETPVSWDDSSLQLDSGSSSDGRQRLGNVLHLS